MAWSGGGASERRRGEAVELAKQVPLRSGTPWAEAAAPERGGRSGDDEARRW